MAPSLWRKPGTKTFQLVHRSQRDPLIHDPEASDRVLKEVTKPRGAKGQYSAYESSTNPEDDPDKAVAEEEIQESPFGADASSYGIFYNDQEYDYLQHLRSVGDRPDATLVAAPTPREIQRQRKKDKSAMAGFIEREPISQPEQKLVLPEDSLPSHPLDEVSYQTYHQQRQLEETGGLKPDLDPRVREVLEALEDEAYTIDEEGEGTDQEDEFWNGVLAGGEGDGNDWEEDSEEEEDEVEETGKGIEKLRLANGNEVEVSAGGNEWDAVKRFKASQANNGSDDEEFESEMGDTIAELVKSSARRPPRGTKGGTNSAMGSSFSMSSSAMFRNEGLRTLDDRFDQIEKMYDESDDDSWGGGGGGGSDDDSEAGEFHGPQREDLEQIMDDFLSRYEVIGGKMRQQLKPLHSQSSSDPNSSEYADLDPEEAVRRANASKLDRIRASLATLDIDGEDDEVEQRRKEKERILKIVERQEREEERRARKGLGRETPKVDILEDRRRDRWDCETVLSTYSNLSNHPRLLRIRDNKLKTPKPAQIKLDPKTGFPLVDGELVTGRQPGDTIMEEPEEDDEEEEMEEYIPKETIKRSRDETPEEKKLRKQLVKNDRQSRRTEKKATKESFEKEVKRQKKVNGRRVAEGGAADIKPGTEGVRRLA
ncbi:ribosome biogenesis protein LTV1 [Sporobolomyces salmoneus]|uniref:ribosome biogenesis protein LTV1 n=1 Tax=Sporobolomyces salmoneus TaxID=183962 RepID=UPI003175B1B2